MKWPAPAKVNLFLHVVGRRDDGYHLLQTWFQFVDWCDWIEIEPTRDGHIERVTDLNGVEPVDDLVVRAATLLQSETGTSFGARIAVDKQLPLGGGLGGGSSDAATTLVALDRIWGLGLGRDRLCEMGASLGADVPVFVGGEAAWAEGVGEVLAPLAAPMGPILILTPDCHVDTRSVFQDPQLTRDTPSIKIPDLPRARLHNDCVEVTRSLYPEVGVALDWLGGFAEARMSGTGASVYAVFKGVAEARAVAAQVPASWRWQLAERCNRSPLLDAVAEYDRDVVR